MDEEKKEEDLEIVPEEENSGSSFNPAEKLKKSKEKLAACEKEKTEYLDGWQRAKAEFINYKKDEGKRAVELAKFVVSGLLADLLPVLDSFDLALASLDEESKEAKGVFLIRSQFLDALKKYELEAVTAGPGDKFDPARHESLGEIESEHPPGEIAEVVQKGYALNGKILRPVRVKISKNITR